MTGIPSHRVQTAPARTRVLVVDDSPTMRRVIVKMLTQDPQLVVVGEAADGIEAQACIAALTPDVITLDVEMPRMNGIDLLATLCGRKSIPAVVVSSLTVEGGEMAMRAYDAGAIAVIAKANEVYSAAEMGEDLRLAVRAAARARLATRRKTGHPKAVSRKLYPSPMPSSTSRVLVVGMGASAGGTVALETVLRTMPHSMPAILIVQHMPPGFTAAFAKRLNSTCRLNVCEAQDGDRLAPGTALIAPGGMHMRLRSDGQDRYVEVAPGERVKGHRPSIDILFESIADVARQNAMGVILTGMGSDGVQGLQHMRNAGALTLSQDEKTSLVYGMPRIAIETGASTEAVALEALGPRIVRTVHGDR